MIEFKILKYKHYRRARELSKLIEAGQAGDEDILAFALSLVSKWDFVDAETSNALALGEMDELSTDQIGEVLTAFGAKFSQPMTVPKANAAPSPSI